MRLKLNAQTELDFRPSNLKLTNEYYAKYNAISRILDANPKIVDTLHEDLKHPLKYMTVKGKDGRPHHYTTDQILRILLAQLIEGGSLRQAVIRIDDSHFLRRFTRIYHGPMMDFTTLDKFKNSIRPKTWHRVNQLLAHYAAEEDLIHPERLRLDTTVVETNIHWPTDSSLLWDSYRVLARLIAKVRQVDPRAVGSKRLHSRRARKLHAQITRRAGLKRARASDLKPLYSRLVTHVEAICDWAAKVMAKLRQGLVKNRYNALDQAMVQALLEKMESFQSLALRVIDQTRRRVLKREKVPNEQKLFSLFEPHTELLVRGKAGKPIEFGHTIQIQQVAEKFITDYEVFLEKPVEPDLLEGALKSHRRLFGQDPDEVGADKGYYRAGEGFDRLRERIKVLSIGKKGKRTVEETEREKDPAFRHVQRFRAGVEGTVSFLKRVLGLLRCMNKGWDHFVATVGATIFSHNLLVLARG